MCVPTSSRGAARGPKKAPDSVRPGGTGRQLGKTSRLAVQGGEVTASVACAVAKRPLPIPPSRIWFALFRLCKAGAVQLGSFAASRALTSLFRLTPSSAARSASAR